MIKTPFDSATSLTSFNESAKLTPAQLGSTMAAFGSFKPAKSLDHVLENNL